MPKSLVLLVILCVVSLLSSCGSGGQDADGFGGLAFTAVWPQDTPAVAHSDKVMQKAPTGVNYIYVIISSGSTTLATGGPYSVATTTPPVYINNVPAGANRTVKIQGFAESGMTTKIYEGTKTGITVIAGTTTNAGSITMYVASGMTGKLDTTFDADGMVFSSIVPTVTGMLTTVAIQPDGKIVAAGTYGNNMGAARYLPSGALDATCDGDGLVSIPANSFANAQAIVVQPDGKILVAGSSQVGSNNRFTFSRRNGTDCSPDGSFGSGGIVTAVVGTTGSNGAHAAALLSSGDIIAVGYAATTGGSDFALGVISGATGTLFSQTTTTFFSSCGGSCSQGANAVAVQSDGKILAAGYANTGSAQGFAVARYNANLTLDTSFVGTGGGLSAGKAWTSHNSVNGYSCSGTAVGIQADGKIVVGGQCIGDVDIQTHVALARFNANGTIDSSFGGNAEGIVIIPPVSTCGENVSDLKIQPDGKIIVSGTVSSGFCIGSVKSWLLARFDSNGNPDPSFNPSGPKPGTVTFAMNGSGMDFANALALQSDGKIVAVGSTEVVSLSTRFGLARLWNDVTTTGKVYGVENGLLGVYSTWTSSQTVTTPALYTVQTPSSTAVSLNGLFVDAAANRLYTRGTGTTGDRLYVFDTINNMTIAEIPVGMNGGVVAYSGTNRAYANNNDSGAGTTVTVIDTTTNSVIATIPGFSAPGGMVLDAASNRLYVVNNVSNTVSVVDTVTNTIVSTLTGFSGPNSLAFDEAAGKLFVVNGGSNTVTAVTLATNARSTMTVGTGPIRASFDSAAQRLYVANYNNGSGSSVSVINTATSAVIDTINTIVLGPRSVRVDSTAKKLYVDCEGDQTIHVYDVTGDGKTQVGTMFGGWANMFVAP